ncbi:tail fiber protein [Saccharibacillus sp. CPCC 101409]|uniref:phage tail protein n=1 Tax=Saccharibacillus sp. CPCC 101409 TaxID=3058041 RepID=UPI002672913E|nr:tail fiber protein [Saccharibacillus sp. CPCC 101409]MDO3410553.1 tail fiber protein [Saccharibacillus sp. CPCC 101409]
MADPYMGEIRIFAGKFAPRGWALCQGQLLAIRDNTALFALLGTAYGGDGVQTFGLPDLRGRVPIHSSASFPRGAAGGTEAETVNVSQLPSHTHLAQGVAAAGTQASPAGAYWAGAPIYSDAQTGKPVQMSPQAISAAGGGTSHENMMPSLTVNFIIALVGIFPMRP